MRLYIDDSVGTTDAVHWCQLAVMMSCQCQTMFWCQFLYSGETIIINIHKLFFSEILLVSFDLLFHSRDSLPWYGKKIQVQRQTRLFVFVYGHRIPFYKWFIWIRTSALPCQVKGISIYIPLHYYEWYSQTMNKTGLLSNKSGWSHCV